MRLRAQLAALVSAVTLGFAGAHAQTTRTVPSTPYPTIQSAIVASANGDTVQVSPGTYTENLNFLGKDITVTGTQAASTILKGDGTTAVVTFNSGETRAASLQNFTIENGGASSSTYSVPEGGVYISGASPVVQNNVFQNNACNAIAVVAVQQATNPLISGNTLTSTRDLGTTLCRDTDFVSSYGNLSYGGVALFLRGTLHSTQTIAEITGNTFTGNVQGTGAGAILSLAEGWFATSNIITGNAAGTGSALMAVTAVGPFTFAQNLVYGNTSNNTGFYHAAIDLYDETNPLNVGALSSFFTNNTVYGNTVGTGYSYATDVYIGSSGAPTLSFVNNVVEGGTYGFPPLYCAPGTAQLVSDVLPAANNDLFNTAGGAASAGVCAPAVGSFGNFSMEAGFTDPAKGDFHPYSGSPLIDAGNNSYTADPGKAAATPNTVYPTLATDLDGETRLYNGVIDIGAFEFQSGTLPSPTTLVAWPSASNGASVIQTLIHSSMGVPAGVIDFLADGVKVGSATVASDGQTSLTLPSLAPGAREITTQYEGSGAFTPATSVPFFIVIDKYAPTLTLTSSANNVPQCTPVTYTLRIQSPDTDQLSPLYLYDANGAIQLAMLTPDSTGTATYTDTTLAQGVHNLSAYYPGDNAHNPARATLTETLTAPTCAATATTLSFTATPAIVNFGDPVELAATVAPPVSGTLAITDNGAPLVSQSLAAGAAFADTVTTFAVGTHQLLSTFTPDSPLYLASIHVPVTVTVNAVTPPPPPPPSIADFTFVPASATVSVQTTHHVSTGLRLTSVNGFTGTVTLSCGPLPEYLTCELPAAQPTLSANGTITAPVTLDTDALLNFALLAPLGLLLCRKRRRKLSLAAALLLLTLTACSGKQPSHTPPGDYTLTFTATSGALTHTTTLRLHVTP